MDDITKNTDLETQNDIANQIIMDAFSVMTESLVKMEKDGFNGDHMMNYCVWPILYEASKAFDAIAEGEKIVLDKKFFKELVGLESEEVDPIPEFVDSWERPDKGETPSIIIEECPESQFYKKEVIKDYKQESEDVGEEKEDILSKPQLIYDGPSLEAHWYGHFTSYSGFSRQNRAFVFGLSNRNVKIKVDIQDAPIEVNKATQNELKILAKSEIDPAAPKIYGATVPLRLAHAGRKILYTMMETSKTLHDGYVGRINLYDEIWVPTHQGKELFKNNGVRPPIYVMPLGVDVSRYHPNARPMSFGFGLKNFVFVSVFKWGYRKGYDILLKAFMEEFSADDDVSLLIISRTDINHKPEVIMEDFKNLRNGILKKDNELPHIALYDKPIKERDMPGVYAAADAFVLISRGEGFGLIYCEAGASNLPVIASNCSGHSDFLNHDNAFLVEPDVYTEARINGNMSKLAKHCGFYEDQIFPDFGRKAIEQTKEHMRSVYEDQDEALIKSAMLRKKVIDNYTWDIAIDKVYNRLREIG
jgi:glycosyltransferase involved in cell wall biosynthesis